MAKMSRWSGSFGLVIKEQRGKQRLPGRLKGQRFDLSTHQAARYFQFLTNPCELLDFPLGHKHVAVFRRGGELTHDETKIIAGVLEFNEKTASDAMTLLAETFAIDTNIKLDRNLINLILEKGHSGVPVYYGEPTNIIGLVLIFHFQKTSVFNMSFFGYFPTQVKRHW